MNIGELTAILRVQDRDYNSKVDQAGSRFTALGNKVRDGAARAASALTPIGAAASRIAGRVGATLGSVPGRYLAPIGAGAVAAAKRVDQALGGVPGRVLRPIGAAAVTSANVVRSAYGSTFGSLAAGFTGAANAGGRLSGAMYDVGTRARTVANSGAGVGSSFVQGFRSSTAAASAFTGAMGTAGGRARQVFDGVSSAARSTGSAVLTAGHQLTAGFRQPTAAAAQWSGVMGTAGGVASRALGGARTAAVAMGSGIAGAAARAKGGTDGLSGSMGGLGAQMAGLAGAIGIAKIGSDVLTLTNKLDSTRRVLTGLYGNAQSAGDMLDRIGRLSRGSALDHTVFLQAGESLAYMGIQGQVAEDMLRNLDAATTVAGTGAVGMQSALDGMLNSVNSGGVQLDHLNQISQAGVPIYSSLAQHFGVAGDELKKMVTDGKVSVQDLHTVIQTGSGDLFKQMIDASGNATNSMSNQWKIFRGNFVTGMATQVLPLVERAGSAFVGFNEKAKAAFDGIPAMIAGVKAAMDAWGVTDAFRNIGVQLGTLSQVAGPFLRGVFIGLGIAIGGVVHIVSLLLTVISPLTEYLARNQGIAQTLGIVIGVLSGAFLAGKAAILLYRGAAFLLGPAFTLVGGAMDILKSKAVATAASTVASWVSMAVGATLNAIRTAAAWLMVAGPRAASAVAQTAAAVTNALVHWARMAWMSMLHAGRVAAAWLITTGANAWAAVSGTAVAVTNALVHWARMAWMSMMHAGRVAGAWLLTAGINAVTAVAATAVAAGQMVARWTMMAVGAMARAVMMAAAWFVALGPVGWVIAIVIGLVALIIANWDTVKSWTLSAWSAITSFISNAWSTIVSTVAGWIASAVAFIVNGWNSAKAMTSSAWSSLVSTIASFIGSAIAWVAGIPGRVLGALAGLGSLLVGSGRALVDGFLNGIKSAWNAVVGWVKDGISAVRALFPFSPAKEGPFSGSGYVTHSGKAIATDFAKSLRQGMPGVIESARQIVDAAHAELKPGIGTGLPGMRGGALPGASSVGRRGWNDRDGGREAGPTAQEIREAVQAGIHAGLHGARMKVDGRGVAQLVNSQNSRDRRLGSTRNPAPTGGGR